MKWFVLASGFVPFTAFWFWTAVVSVLLLIGRLAAAEPARLS